jgi:CDP-glycerol glycerophosphotransferase
MTELEPIYRIAVLMICKLDIAETLKVVDYIKHGYKLSTDLVERSGRVYWTDKYLDSDDDRAILDVTGLGLHSASFRHQSVFNRVTSFALHGPRMIIEGELSNQLGQIRPRDELTIALAVRNRKRTKSSTTPVTSFTHDGSRIRYRFDVELGPLVGALKDAPAPTWRIYLRVTWKGQTTGSPFTVDPAMLPSEPLTIRTPLGETGTFEMFVTSWGNLAMRLLASRQAVLPRAARAIRHLPLRAKKRVLAASQSPALKMLAFRIGARLPAKRGLAVFESHMGRSYSDSPKYIFEAARARGLPRLGLDPVWVYATSARGFPDDARRVRRLSWSYYWLLARARFWIDNQGFPRQFPRPAHTTYLQTWHGTPFKRMGFDTPEMVWATQRERRELSAMIDRWSCLLAPSEYFVDTFVRAYRTDVPLLRVGLPRNDPLVRGADQKWVARKREELRLPADRKIILYCPTFRDRKRKLGRARFRIPFNLRRMQEELGQTHYILIRAHYLDQVKTGWETAGFTQNVSRYPDVTELMLVSDILVTDYSSVMFDYANLGRPMVFYANDYDDYSRVQRGTYFNLFDEAPGPVVTDTQGLIEALGKLDDSADAYRERYERFRRTFCEYETGAAADAVVDQFFDAARERE